MTLPSIDITTEPDFANPLAVTDKGLGVQSGILGQYAIQKVYDLLMNVLGTEIHGLAAAATPALTDEVGAYNGVAAGKKETLQQILNLFMGAGVAALTNVSVPALTDKLGDSQGGNPFYITLTQVLNLFMGAGVAALTNVSVPALTDKLGDSQGGNPFYITLTQVLALFQANWNLGINVQTGTTYKVAASDNGKVIVFTNGSAVTITLPQQSDIALPVGFNCLIRTAGAGAGTFALEGSDTKVGNAGTGANATNDAGVVLRTTVSTVNNFDIFGGV